MKQYINRDMLIGFPSGSSKKELQYPLRVGRKQKRAVLDANGVEVVIFNKGQEELAQLTCDLLNKNNKVGGLVDKHDYLKVTLNQVVQYHNKDVNEMVGIINRKWWQIF